MDAHPPLLPDVDGRLYLSDGGLETCLIFHEDMALPDFAAFVLLGGEDGRRVLRRYYQRYIDIARAERAGFVLESATWRASADWGRRLGYDAAGLAEANREALRLVADLRRKNGDCGLPMVISGCVGPRGDGYRPDLSLSADDAAAYHRAQIETFADTEADMISAITMNAVPEALGFVRAAGETGMPCVVSFTVETDGRLPDGTPLEAAIQRVDETSDAAPAYYMLNCAHPVHIRAGLLPAATSWTARIRGLRVNASCLSHAELDAAEQLDAGDPEALAADCVALRTQLPALQVLGGCCGTDHTHVWRMAAAWRAAEAGMPDPQRPAA